MSNSVNAHYGDMAGDIRMLDTAKGILIALRRCSAEQAFRELVCAAKDYQVGILTLSRALVTLAESLDEPARPPSRATQIARHQWSALFARSALNG
jgi:ANTAR domain